MRFFCKCELDINVHRSDVDVSVRNHVRFLKSLTYSAVQGVSGDCRGEFAVRGVNSAPSKRDYLREFPQNGANSVLTLLSPRLLDLQVDTV